MFEVVSGNIWNFAESEKELHPLHIIVIPTNGVVKTNGALVMGAGLAKQAVERLEGLDFQLGAKVANKGNHVFFMWPYGICSFPTKNHWKMDSSIELIRQSAKELNAVAIAHHGHTFYLPKVGTGKGKLAWSDVRPVLEKEITSSNVILVEG